MPGWFDKRVEEDMLKLSLVALLASVSAAPAAGIEGRASVIDGDTIEIHGERIRLEGIDAPESNQPCTHKRTGQTWRCGQQASIWLSDLIGARTVSCVEAGRDRWKRMLAHCTVGGQDIGAEMVRNGWAMAFIRYSKEYVPEETEARSAGAGIWASEFDPPWDWRRAKRPPQ